MLTLSYKSSLDEKLISLLAPLLEARARIFFPFFANTFPLAFHYHDLLSTYQLEVNQLINLLPWGEERELQLSSDTTALYYTTAQSCSSLVDVSIVPVTQFQPRWIFSEFHLALIPHDALNATVNRSPKEFSDLVHQRSLLQKFEHFEVFSEIPDQAAAIMTNLMPADRFTIFRLATIDSVFADTNLKRETLRLFLYGAPLSAYFRRKPTNYIPFTITINNPVFETVVAITGPLQQRQALATAIREYHKLLYDAAANINTTQISFRRLQYFYNRLARLLQHRSSFPSAEEFAACLATHHKSPT